MWARGWWLFGLVMLPRPFALALLLTDDYRSVGIPASGQRP